MISVDKLCLAHSNFCPTSPYISLDIDTELHPNKLLPLLLYRLFDIGADRIKKLPKYLDRTYQKKGFSQAFLPLIIACQTTREPGGKLFPHILSLACGAFDLTPLLTG